MHYINNPNSPAKTYQQIMDIAIGNGVDPKRVYIYLASMGVRGELARIFDGDQYGEPVKMGITGKNTLVTQISICKTCKGLVVNDNQDVQLVEPVKSKKPKLITNPAFSSWLVLSANEYKSIESAYEVTTLNSSMTIEEFSKLFKQHYKMQDKNGLYIKE